MASYSVTTTAQTVATSGNRWLFTHSAGTANVFLESQGRTLGVVQPSGALSLFVGADVTARTSSGTATLDVTDYVSSQDGDVIDGGTP